MRYNKKKGENMKNYVKYVDTPIGIISLVSDGTSLTQLGGVSEIKETKESCLVLEEASKQLLEYFNGKRKQFDLPLHLEGTVFQKKVWKALCNIPYGETRSYKQIAEAVGSPKAMRAVGGANHNNPIMIVVPCHRVIGANGSLVGFGGGLPMKVTLLELEQKYK